MAYEATPHHLLHSSHTHAYAHTHNSTHAHARTHKKCTSQQWNFLRTVYNSNTNVVVFSTVLRESQEAEKKQREDKAKSWEENEEEKASFMNERSLEVTACQRYLTCSTFSLPFIMATNCAYTMWLLLFELCVFCDLLNNVHHMFTQIEQA